MKRQYRIKQFIVCVALIFSVSAAPDKRDVPRHRPLTYLNDEELQHITNEDDYKHQPPTLANGGIYHFEYQTEDGSRREESGIGGVSVQGSYAYVSPDGTPVHVAYIADHNGFRPIGNVISEHVQRSYFPQMANSQDHDYNYQSVNTNPKIILDENEINFGKQQKFNHQSGHNGKEILSHQPAFSKSFENEQVKTDVPQHKFIDSPELTQAIVKPSAPLSFEEFDSDFPSNHHETFREPGFFNRLVNKGFEAIKGLGRHIKNEVSSKWDKTNDNNQKDWSRADEKENKEESLKNLTRIKRS